MESLYDVLDWMSYLGGLLFCFSFLFMLVLFGLASRIKEKE